MKVVVDYRPALRARSGVGEYVHHAACAYAATFPDDRLTLFTSSWKDRPAPSLAAECRGVGVSDHRIPVALLNLAWHRLEWPPIERLARSRFDVAFSPHPLLMPARSAAQVVMVHDLDFIRHPERTTREIRRDYPSLVRSHVARAARVIVPSRYTAEQVVAELDVPRGRVVVCAPGAPRWREQVQRPASGNGYLLFVGTLEPRKNIERLLQAYERLIARHGDLPPLMIAGQPGAAADAARDRLSRRPLNGRVEYRGFVADAERPGLFAGARALVLPSLEEGFGMPALEAMSLGIPVVASNRGALPELVGDGGVLVDPEDVDAIAAGIESVLKDRTAADAMGERGARRSRAYDWAQTARTLRDAFAQAMTADAAEDGVA
jgi:glycosyltransferase involved in cell wall biosynthesis